MRTTRRHFLIYAALALWLAITFPARSQTARIAVVGDPTFADLIDLTTAELSKSPGLNVLERADLAKLGQEQALQSAISSSDPSNLQFVPADGLIILRAFPQPKGKVDVLARLVAVQPGVILRETVLPEGNDPSVQAQAVAKEFAPYWPKLAAIQKGNVAALSLLGLRFDVDAPQTHELERLVNILLASRLGSEPDVVVLERWRLSDAVFEKSLHAQQTAPFWTGSSLIDGGMKWSNNQVEVSLRVRPPQGAETTISDKDTPDNILALVGRLAGKIRAHPIAPGAWQPAAEADHYAALAKWCLDNHLYDEGAAAVESALALGNTSRTTHMLQVRAYAVLTYPDDLQNSDPGHGTDSGYGHVSVSRDSLPGRLQAGEQAANLASQYLEANAGASDAQGTLEDPMELGGAVLRNCVRTLRLAYEQGYAGDMADLRHALQNLIAQLSKVSADKPADVRKTFRKYAVQYAAFWHESPEATMDYYRDLLGSKTDGASNRRDLFEPGYPILHRPYLDADAGLPGAPAWYIGSPWLIAWDDRPAAEIKTLWKNFLAGLASSSDPVVQSDALKFEFSSLQTQPKRDAAGAQFVACLHQNRDIISGPRGNEFVAGFYPAIQWAARNPDASARNDLRELIVAQLKARAILPAEWITHFSFLFYSRDKTDESQDFLAAFDDYRMWYATQLPQDPAVVAALAQVQNLYVASVTGGAPASPAAGFLPVHTYWPTQKSVGIPGQPGWSEPPRIDTQTFMTTGDKIWFMARSTRFDANDSLQETSQVLCVDPSNLQTVASYDIPNQYNQRHDGDPSGTSIDVAPQGVAAVINGHVLLCPRAGNQWRSLDVPPSNYRPRWIGPDLYLLYEYNPQFAFHTTGASSAATAVSGLIHVNLPGGEIENVVSSRRVPPQTALDGKPIGYALDLWKSGDDLMFALNPDSPCFQIFGAASGSNDWKWVESDTVQSDVKIGPEGALIGKGFDGQGFVQLVLMKGDTTQVLLSNPKHVPVAGGGLPLWDCPDDMSVTVSVGLSQLSPVMRGNDLCVYRNVNNGIGDGRHASLYYFASGQKSALKIPLEFGIPGMTNIGFIRMQTFIPGYQSLQSTNDALIINNGSEGFWAIPWADIDAYRGKGISVGNSAMPPVSSAPAPVVPPAPVEAFAPVRVSVPAPSPVPVIKVTPAATPAPVTPQPPVAQPASVAPIPQVPAARSNWD